MTGRFWEGSNSIGLRGPLALMRTIDTSAAVVTIPRLTSAGGMHSSGRNRRGPRRCGTEEAGPGGEAIDRGLPGETGESHQRVWRSIEASLEWRDQLRVSSEGVEVDRGLPGETSYESHQRVWRSIEVSLERPVVSLIRGCGGR